MRQIVSTPEIDAAISRHAVVAFGVSGGKDGAVAVEEVNDWLDTQGHPRSRRLLIHADLGEIEWRASEPHCRELARRADLELVVLEAEKGGLIGRFHRRWESMSSSYRELRRVTLTMPWSSAALRFCTSETKSARMAAYLKTRFMGQEIISVCGLRRQESAKRALAAVAKVNPRLFGKSAGTFGWDWNPVLAYTLDDVWAVHKERGIPIHVAYTRYGTTRVSCVFCIMQSAGDQLASFANPEHRGAWRELSELEIVSGFSFQPKRWLADIGTEGESEEFRERLLAAKVVLAQRTELERAIPERLLYVKGWPTFVPEREDCELLARVRSQVCRLYGWTSAYLDADAVRGRYAELFAARNNADPGSAVTARVRAT